MIDSTAADETVKDPVCGMFKPKSEMKEKTMHKGKEYYFCSESDREMFSANPDHWIPRDQK